MVLKNISKMFQIKFYGRFYCIIIIITKGLLTFAGVNKLQVVNYSRHKYVF